MVQQIRCIFPLCWDLVNKKRKTKAVEYKNISKQLCHELKHRAITHNQKNVVNIRFNGI